MAHPTLFARLADLALFLFGALMVVGGIFVADHGAVQSILIVLGAGLMVMGAVLPRLSGTIKITPTSLELSVIQQLEATLRQAERVAPNRVEEAVGLAFRRVAETGALSQILAGVGQSAASEGAPTDGPGEPPQKPPAAEPAPAPSAGERAPARRALRVAPAAALVVGVGAGLVVATSVFMRFREAPSTTRPRPPSPTVTISSPPTATILPSPSGPQATAPEPGPAPTADRATPAAGRGPVGPPVSITLAAMGAIVVAATGLVLLRRHRRGPPSGAVPGPEGEPAEEFARRIVAEVVRRPRDPPQ